MFDVYQVNGYSNDIASLNYTDTSTKLYANNDSLCKYDSYYISNIGEFKVIRTTPTYNGPDIDSYFDFGELILTCISDTKPTISIGSHSYSDGYVSIYQDPNNRSHKAKSDLQFDMSFFDQIYFIGHIPNSFENFKEYLKHIYGNNRFKLPNNIYGFRDENGNGIQDSVPNNREYDLRAYSYLTKQDIVTNVESYDLSLYGITYATEYIEVPDPSLE